MRAGDSAGGAEGGAVGGAVGGALGGAGGTGVGGSGLCNGWQSAVRGGECCAPCTRSGRGGQIASMAAAAFAYSYGDGQGWGWQKKGKLLGFLSSVLWLPGLLIHLKVQ